MEETSIHKVDRNSNRFKHNPNQYFWTSDDSACEICGKRFFDLKMAFDMFDPNTEAASVICHKSCGSKFNLEIV
jgi:hypothetical protein